MAFSFFFRDLPVIESAAEHLARFASGRMRVKAWDAGAALGQETYTFAIVLAEKMGQFAFNNLKLEATDCDRANRFGEAVKKGVYKFDDLKRMPEHLFKKYFEPAEVDGYFRVIDKVRSRVSFQYHDLLTSRPIGEGYCLVLCKNVLLHFSHAQRVEVIKMFHRALLPGGFLTTERTQKLPEEVSHLFEQVAADASLYKKTEAAL